jgi:hypothetical protein
MLRASPAVNLPLTRPLGWAVGDFFGRSLSGRACGRRAPNRDFRDRSFNSQTTSMSIKLSRKSASCRSRPRAWSQVATSMTSSEGCATNHARHGVHRSSKVAPRKAQEKSSRLPCFKTLPLDLASSPSSCGMTAIALTRRLESTLSSHLNISTLDQAVRDRRNRGFAGVERADLRRCPPGSTGR